VIWKDDVEGDVEERKAFWFEYLRIPWAGVLCFLCFQLPRIVLS